MIIGADIGGTKALFGWFEIRSDGKTILKFSKQYPSDNYNCLEDAIETFVSDVKQDTPTFDLSQIESACFSLAGPIFGDECHMVNLGWDVSVKTIKQRFPQIGEVILRNDLEATAVGVQSLKKRDFCKLNSAEVSADGVKAIIAPGTGLGEALVIGDRVISSEGGHSDFAPNNDEEVELLHYLQKKYGHVSYERILSGQGLCDLKNFLTEKNSGAKETKSLLPEDVTYRALSVEIEDKEAAHALDMFVEILGAEAGNLALKSLPYGGIYLAGGIPPRILSRLKEDDFMERFTDKGRCMELMQKIPVFVVRNNQAALYGSGLMALKNVLHET